MVFSSDTSDTGRSGAMKALVHRASAPWSWNIVDKVNSKQTDLNL